MQGLIKEANVFDYVTWRSDLSFENSPINKIDILILIQLAIVNFDGIVPALGDDFKDISLEDAYHQFEKEKRLENKIGLIIPNTVLSLFKNIHNTKRYKQIKMSDYIDIISIEKEEQVSAITFEIDKDTFLIGFSGTDDTIIGWKENFNMIYKFPVESQIEANNYVNKVMRKHPNAKFYIAGHSKGGNMTIYSTCVCDDDVAKRIIASYSFDGQGVNPKDESFFKEDRVKKITSIIPQSSVVGVLFSHKEKTYYVKSIQQGAYQHDIFSWMIKVCDFCYVKDLTNEGKAVRDKTKEILANMTELEKEKFSSNLYAILCAGHATNLTTLNEVKKASFDAYFKMPKEERKYIHDPIHKLLKDKNIQRTVLGTLKAIFNEYRINREETKENERRQKKQNEISQ